MITRCPSCSKAIDEKDDVCPFCGKDFTVAAKPAAKPAAPPPGPRTTKPAPPPPPPAPKPRAAPPSKPPEGHLTEDGVWVPPTPEKPPSALGWNIACAVILGAAVFVLWARRPETPRSTRPASAGQEGAAAPIEGWMTGMGRQEAAPAPPPEASAPAQKPLPRPKPTKPLPAPQAPEEPIVLEQTPPSMREWKFQGKVFDLITLKPVAEADIVFADPESTARYNISTNAEGVYRVVMPSNSGGYDVRIAHPEYESRFIQDGTPPLRTLPLSRRRALIAGSDSTIQHRELFSPGPTGRLKKDLALIPTKLPPP